MLVNIYYPRSIVLGLYGGWGEGKTSIINCIQTEIKILQQAAGEDTVVLVHFNPWLFSDEKQLIKSFFSTVASALGRKLKGNREKFLELFIRYAEEIGAITDLHPSTKPLGPFFKGAKKVAEDFRKEESLEILKAKIDTFIQDSGLNLVVFIDDIDRLDITETQLIFKLVKLLGDFPRTAYILAFDEAVVAKALAEKYPSESDQAPGYTFLEKIIQIPLHIPKADSVILRSFLFELIENVHKQIKIKLTDQERTDFQDYFDATFLPLLSNPRTAIRYANAIGFFIPLIEKEANILDIMIMEAIKEFHPKMYQFIRYNPDFFLRKQSDVKAQHSISEYGKILKRYPASGESLPILLGKLFPMLWPNIGSTFDDQMAYAQKRICSPHYFNRYFTYAVQKGEISDITFESAMEKIAELKTEDAVVYLKRTIEDSSVDAFLLKLKKNYGNIPVKNIPIVGGVLLGTLSHFRSTDESKLFKMSDRIFEVVADLSLYNDKGNELTYAQDMLSLGENFQEVCLLADYFIRKFEAPESDKGLKAAVKPIFIVVSQQYQEFLNEGHHLSQMEFFEAGIALKALFTVYGKERVKQIVAAEYLYDIKFILTLIKVCTTVTINPNLPGVYHVKFHESSQEQLEQYCDIQHLYYSLNPYFFSVSKRVKQNPKNRAESDDLAIAEFKQFCDGDSGLSLIERATND